MTIEIIDGCLLDAFDRGDVNVIGHCCNAQGKMNSGIAKSIRERYPHAYNRYISFYNQCGLDVGDIIGASIGWESDRKIIFNLIGQEYYGYDGKKYLSDEGFKKCLALMSLRVKSSDTIGFPYLMGCDRAGGDFNIVMEWVRTYFKDFNVKFYKLQQ